MYATLDDARRELGTGTSVNAAADAQLRTHIATVSRRVDDLLGFGFEPTRKTEYLPLRGDLLRSDLRLYKLPRWALELHAVTVYGTSLTITTNVIGWPSGRTPFKHMQLVSTDGVWTSTYYSDSYDPLVVVEATWGYHSNYAEAWQAEDAIQNVGGINASATSITVADADGTNYEGFTGRFAAGQLLQIGTELLRVTAVNTTTNILTVVRGVNGSTAAAHDASAAISVWYPEPTIRQVVARQAALLYKRQGALTAPTQLGMGGSYPPDLLPDLYAVMQEYHNL